MKNYKTKKATGEIFGSLLSFLPLILLGFGGFIVFNYFKKSGGLLNFLGHALGGSDGSDVSQITTDKALSHVADVIKAKGLEPNALHTAQANSIFDLFNAVTANPFQWISGMELSEANSKEVYDTYNAVTYTADDAMVYVQYGRRKVPNRQNQLLGFLWDNTEGDLRQHSERYLDKAYRAKMLALIDRAIKSYLI